MSPANPQKRGPTIDVHAHVLLPPVEEAVAGHPGLAAARDLDARRNGPEAMAVSGPMFRDRVLKLTDVEARLAAMDASGIDVQLISPSPSHYHYWADERLARTVWELANEGTAAHVAHAPERLHGLGLVPLQHPALAVEALQHALDLGLRGAEISSHAPGLELSDPAYEPFWTRAEETGAILFLHPFGCTLDERLDRWYLSNTVGQPAENAVALSHLIFSGVLDSHPGLRIIAAHGGGYLPTHIGRSDHAWRARTDARGCAHPPSSYLKRLYFDSLVHDPHVLRELIRVAGPDRVLLGSDFPFDMGTDDPLGALRAVEDLPDSHLHAVRGDNAAALLSLV